MSSPRLCADSPELVRIAKLRWRIERDYQELKQELGLAHFEGRGFHHHATPRMAAHGFLATERLGGSKKPPAHCLPGEGSPLPVGFRPRGPYVSSAMYRIPSPRCDVSLLQHCLPDFSAALAAAGTSSRLLTQWY